MVNDTISSPRRTTRPSTRRSSLCGGCMAQIRAGHCLMGTHRHSFRGGYAALAPALRTSSSLLPFFGGRRLNSSESPRTRFRWRSKAMNL